MKYDLQFCLHLSPSVAIILIINLFTNIYMGEDENLTSPLSSPPLHIDIHEVIVLG